MQHEAQIRYSELIDKKLRINLVTVDGGKNPVFNTRYEGEPTAGAVKIPVRDTEVEIGSYDKRTGKAVSHGSTSYIIVTDFYDVAVNELIDGYDAGSVPDGLLANRLESAAYSGALKLDKDAIATLEKEGTPFMTAAALTKATVYDAIVDASTELTKQNVPMRGRCLIISPELHGLLLKSDSFVKQSDIGQELVSQGFVGMISGFPVKVSNNLDEKTEFVALHSDWCHRIREWVSEPRLVSLDGDSDFVGASAIKGRWLFKHKVSKAAAVQVKKRA